MKEGGTGLDAQKKKVLGLVGSPRRLGNCEVMVKEISNNIKEEHTLGLIRIPSLNIRPCTACYGCVMDKPCPKTDDMAFLLDNLAGADAFIIASPVYFLGAHSIFKQVLDRGFLLYTILPRTYGKPCILLNLYGMDDRLGAAPHTLMTFASFLGLQIKAQENIKAALPGEALLVNGMASRTKAMAESLFSPGKAPHNHGCPFCGCDIARFGKKEFTCTLCHGTFRLDGKGNTEGLKEGGIFGTLEHMLLHKTWLAGMKDEFLTRKRELIKMTLPYKDTGEWLEP